MLFHEVSWIRTECQALNNRDTNLAIPLVVLLVRRVLATMSSQLQLREAVSVAELPSPLVQSSRVMLPARLDPHKSFRR